MTEEDFLKKIGKRIKQIRKEKGLSQQQFAAALDYEKSNASRLESGKINPKIGTLYKVAKVLNVTLSYLIDNIDMEHK